MSDKIAPADVTVVQVAAGQWQNPGGSMCCFIWSFASIFFAFPCGIGACLGSCGMGSATDLGMYQASKGSALMCNAVATVFGLIWIIIVIVVISAAAAVADDLNDLGKDVAKSCIMQGTEAECDAVATDCDWKEYGVWGMYSCADAIEGGSGAARW